MSVFARHVDQAFIVDPSKTEEFLNTDARTGRIKAKERFEMHGGSKGVKIIRRFREECNN